MEPVLVAVEILAVAFGLVNGVRDAGNAGGSSAPSRNSGASSTSTARPCPIS